MLRARAVGRVLGWTVGLSVLGAGDAAWGQEIRWQPVSATGDFSITDNSGAIGLPSEITLTPGAEVTLELRLSGWGDAPGAPELGSYQAVVDSMGYTSGLAGALNPLGWPSTPGDGALIAEKICATVNCTLDPDDPACEFDYLSVCDSSPDCPPEYPVCMDRPDFVFAGFGPAVAVSTATLDYEWSAVSIAAGRLDEGETYYGGTLILEVSADAEGAFTVGFNIDPIFTFMNDYFGVPIAGLVLTPVVIDAGTGPAEPPAPEPGGPSCSLDSDCIDEWEGAICVAGTCYAPKNRYLSIDPTTNLDDVAYRVTMTESVKYPACEAKQWWLEVPQCRDRAGDSVDPPPNASCTGEDMFGWVSRLTAAPVFRAWTESPVHIGDRGIVPVTTYNLEASDDGATFSDPLEIMTIRKPGPLDWGDEVGSPFGDPLVWRPPDGSMNFNDVLAVVNTFREFSEGAGFPPRPWSDLAQDVPDARIDLDDLMASAGAFEFRPYPWLAPCDPCTVPGDCNDGLFCNGVETCTDSDCQRGNYPCTPDQDCDEGTDACVPADALMSCQLSTHTAPASSSVEFELFVQDVSGLKGYQTTIVITRTSGSGEVTVSCPDGIAIHRMVCSGSGEPCEMPEDCLPGGFCVDNPDFALAGTMTSISAVDCTHLRAVAFGVLGEPADMGPSPAHLTMYTLNISADAVEGSTFDISIVPDSGSLLRDPDVGPIPFAISPPCTLTIGIIDCDGDGTPDEEEIDPADQDCNGDGTCNGVEIAGCDPLVDPSCDDCNGNGIPDGCDIDELTSEDCNLDGVPDRCEIDENSSAPGGPFYCTSDCDPDCNENGLPDFCDADQDPSQDCNLNNLPDECEIDENSTALGGPFFCDPLAPPAPLVDCDPDCNENGVPDGCDETDCADERLCGDCDGDGLMNECEAGALEQDCNGDGVCNGAEIAGCVDPVADPSCDDCNSNDIPDGCDIGADPSEDCNNNGIPDSCETDFDLGTLASGGGSFTGDTTSSSNDIDCWQEDTQICQETCVQYGRYGRDELFEFKVQETGVWGFDTCTVPAGWDTSLMIRENTGDDCYGELRACDDDDCDVGDYESLVEVFLLAETPYYIIVDGWEDSETSYGPFEVTYQLVMPACTTDIECDDGVWCNGPEVCDLMAQGKCVPSTPPCATHQTCDEDTAACADPDPCWAYACEARLGYYMPGGGIFEGWDPTTLIADDIHLETAVEGRTLLSYDLLVVSRNSGTITGPFDMTTQLWTSVPPVIADLCDYDLTPCATNDDCIGHGALEVCVTLQEPGAPIAGTTCTFTGLPAGRYCVDGPHVDEQCTRDDPPDPYSTFCEGDCVDRDTVVVCDESAGLIVDPPIVLPEDFWIVYSVSSDSAGFSITGPPRVGFSTNLVGYSFDGGTSWTLDSFGYWAFASFYTHFCTETIGGCCLPTDACQQATQDECENTLLGTWTPDTISNPVDCADRDEDGVLDVCDNCPDVSNVDQDDCDGDGQGDACEADALDDDCDDDGTCNGVVISACSDPVADPSCDDCNLNDIPDGCDISDGTSADLTDVTGTGPPDGIPDECQIDSDGDGINNAYDNCPTVPNGAGLRTCVEGVTGTCLGDVECDTSPGSGDGVCGLDQEDGDGDGVGDVCDNCPAHSNASQGDCDNDGKGNVCAIADSDSDDCNYNGIPDLCELTGNDCDGNNVPDECDIYEGRSEDCNENDIPDECDVDPTDPDGNGLTSEDCTSDGTPDECEPDCQPLGEPGHGTADSCDIFNSISLDDNSNDVPDECDLGACCYRFDPYFMCVDTTTADCAASWGAYDSSFLGLDTQCPSDGVATAEHQGTVVLHVTDPAQVCGGEGLRGADCLPGNPIDPWMTAADAVMCHRFGIEPDSPAIPADFFGPGSDPYGSPVIQEVCLEGEPLGVTEYGEFGDADTLIRRTGGPAGTGDPFDRCDLPSETPQTVDTEVLALSLKSAAPITVTYNGGQDPEQWDVTVDRSVVAPPLGSITAVRTHCNGGTYTSVLHVQPRFTFTKVGDPAEVRTLDTGLGGIPYVILTQNDNPPWAIDVEETLGLSSQICSDFHPGITAAELVQECDCNGNGLRDKCDIENCHPDDPNCRDCQPNGIPDGCEPDGDADGVPNDCDVCPGADDNADSDGDGVADGCDFCPGGDDTIDSDLDGVADDCDSCPDDNPDDPDADGACTSGDNCAFFNPEQTDCQPNGIGDACDIAPGGGSLDQNENGVPDECDGQSLQLPAPPHDAPKHRYLSIDPSATAPNAVAIKVEIAEMKRCQNDPRRGCLVDLDCRDVCEDEPNTLCPTGPGVCGGGACINSGPCVDVTPSPPVAWLVQEPQQICAGCLAFGCVSQCDPDHPTDPYVNCCGDEDWVARLSDTVYSQDWSEYSLIHISDCGIIPGITYNVYACDPANISVCSEPLAVGTQQTPSVTHLHFGDIAGAPDVAGDPYKKPDGSVNVIDVSAWGLTKQNYGTLASPQLHPTMADLHGSGYGVPANYILGLSDQQAIINHGFTWALPWDNPTMLGGVDPSTCPGRLP